MSSIIDELRGRVDYAIFVAEDKFQKQHLLRIDNSLDAMVRGQEYMFNCLDCDLSSNEKNIAIDHKLKKMHNVTGPAGWFCRQCSEITLSHDNVLKHQKVFWDHKMFRFDIDQTLKQSEVRS